MGTRYWDLSLPVRTGQLVLDPFFRLPLCTRFAAFGSDLFQIINMHCDKETVSTFLERSNYRSLGFLYRLWLNFLEERP